MKKIWDEYLKAPITIITISYLVGAGFFFGAASAAKIEGATLIIGYKAPATMGGSKP